MLHRAVYGAGAKGRSALKNKMLVELQKAEFLEAQEPVTGPTPAAPTNDPAATSLGPDVKSEEQVESG